MYYNQIRRNYDKVQGVCDNYLGLQNLLYNTQDLNEAKIENSRIIEILKKHNDEEFFIILLLTKHNFKKFYLPANKNLLLYYFKFE